MRFFKNISKKSRSKEDGIFFTKLKKLLGFKPKNLHYYKRAFTHSSTHKTDKNGNPYNYERLEFLGDTMLSSIISAHLFNEVPAGNEGYLTKMRSKIVSRKHLNQLGKDFGLIQFLESTNNPNRFGDNIYGNLFEAFIGAIYLDLGYNYCKKFIHNKVIKPYVNINELEGRIISYKSLMIEWCQKEKKTIQFKTFEDIGNETQKYFKVHLLIDKNIIAKARSTSKKKAEEKAAQRAFFALQEQVENKM